MYDSATGVAGDPNDLVLVLADIQGAVILDAFNANMGGVIDLEGESDVLDGQTIHAKYGVGGAKTLDITQTTGTMTHGDGRNSRRPVSGDGRFGKGGDGSYFYRIDGITGGDPSEAVIMFGGTMIERNDRAMGWTVTATFSDGSTVTATESATETVASDDDTFFGFVAPEGEYITRVNFQSDYTYMDELFFITELGLIPPEVDAGGDQTVEFSEGTTGVSLDAELDYYADGEDYDYVWSGNWTTIDSNEIQDPTVTFARPGEYVLTLNVTGSVYGALVPDTVTINVAANWVGLDGSDVTDWHAGANWDTDPNEPDITTVTYLGKKTAVAEFALTTVNIDAAASAKSLSVAHDPNYPYTLNINSGGLTTAGKLYIANNSTGIVNVLAGSPLTVGDDLIIGDDGVGTLSALANSAIDISDRLQVGDNGDGTLTMTDGSLDVGGNINISKDNDGTGTMTLDGVEVNCDNLRVASNSADGDGSGVGIVTLTNYIEFYLNGALQIGKYGTGTLTSTGGYIDVDDNVEIGMYGTGTLTLNSTDITKPNGDQDASRFLVGTGSGGNGEVIMNGTSRILAGNNVCLGGDSANGASERGTTGPSLGILQMNGSAYLWANGQMRLGTDPNAVGELYMESGTVIELSDDKTGDDLIVGNRGTGTIVTSGRIYVGDQLIVGYVSSRSVGTITMDANSIITTDNGNNSEIWIGRKSTVAASVLNMNDEAYMYCDSDMYIGGDKDDGKSGHGSVYMNDPCTILEVNDELHVGSGGVGIMETSGTIDVGDHMYVARGGGSTGTLTMTSTAVITTGSGKDLVIGSDGDGELNMTGGLITVGDDFSVGDDDSGDGDVTMIGGTINVNDDIDFASHTGGDNINESTVPGVVANLTMSNGALIDLGGDFEFAKHGIGTLTMSGGAKIDVDNSHAIAIGENSGSNATVDIVSDDKNDVVMTCQDLELGRDGGDVDFDIEKATIDIDEDFKVADDIGNDEGTPGVVTVDIDDNAIIKINSDFQIGGNGAQVTITLKDGFIDMEGGNVDDSLSLPDSASGAGYAVLVLGEDANDISFGAAKLELDSYLDYSNADANDYIDFLGGGLLETQIKPSDPNFLTEQEIKDLIISGYFRTTYTQADIDGAVPDPTGTYGDPNVIRVVYEDKGDGRWHIYLGIGSPCIDSSLAGDLSGDCMVDNDDVAVLSAGWGDPYGLAELVDIASTWLDCGMDYGDCDD